MFVFTLFHQYNLVIFKRCYWITYQILLKIYILIKHFLIEYTIYLLELINSSYKDKEKIVDRTWNGSSWKR